MFIVSTEERNLILVTNAHFPASFPPPFCLLTACISPPSKGDDREGDGQ